MEPPGAADKQDHQRVRGRGRLKNGDDYPDRDGQEYDYPDAR
jgi:hypothetical protein